VLQKRHGELRFLAFQQDAGQADERLFKIGKAVYDLLVVLARLFKVALVMGENGELVGGIAVAGVEGELSLKLAQGGVAVFGFCWSWKRLR